MANGTHTFTSISTKTPLNWQHWDSRNSFPKRSSKGFLRRGMGGWKEDSWLKRVNSLRAEGMCMKVGTEHTIKSSFSKDRDQPTRPTLRRQEVATQACYPALWEETQKESARVVARVTRMEPQVKMEEYGSQLFAKQVLYTTESLKSSTALIKGKSKFKSQNMEKLNFISNERNNKL